MGYDESLFESQPVTDGFKCPICTDVLEDPVTVDQCEHLFCSDCIRQWLLDSDQCPVCRQTINEFSLRPSLRQFCSLLASLRMKCQFEECTEVIELGELQQHRRQCQHNPEREVFGENGERIICTQFCGAVLTEDELLEHDCRTFLVEMVHKLTLDKSGLIEQVREMEERVSSLQQPSSSSTISTDNNTAATICTVATAAAVPYTEVAPSAPPIYPNLEQRILDSLNSRNALLLNQQQQQQQRKKKSWKFWQR